MIEIIDTIVAIFAFDRELAKTNSLSIWKQMELYSNQFINVRSIYSSLMYM